MFKKIQIQNYVDLEWLTKSNHPIYKISLKFIVFRCIVNYYMTLNIVLKACD